jgi:hypothetical protein
MNLFAFTRSDLVASSGGGFNERCKQSTNRLEWTVIVAVVAMRVVKPVIHEIVSVITMWNGRMPAVRAVNVLGGMFGSGKARRAIVRVGGINGNLMFVHVVPVRMMQVAVMKIVHVSFMLYGGMPAIFAVEMGMTGVSCASM